MLTWTTMEPVDVADNWGAAASGEWQMAAKAGVAGSRLRVAALIGVC